MTDSITLRQVLSSVDSNSRIKKGRAYEVEGRVSGLKIEKSKLSARVLNNMGRYYDVEVKRATKGTADWLATGIQGSCPCGDPHSLCKHVAAAVFALVRLLAADRDLYETWVGVRADDDHGGLSMDDAAIESHWGEMNDELPDTPEAFGRADELLRRLGPSPMSLGLPELPDLLAPCYGILSTAGQGILAAPKVETGQKSSGSSSFARR